MAYGYAEYNAILRLMEELGIKFDHIVYEKLKLGLMNYSIQPVGMDASFVTQRRETSTTPHFGQFLTRKLLKIMVRLNLFSPSLFHFWRGNINDKLNYLQYISRRLTSRQSHAFGERKGLWREHCGAFW